MVGILRRSLALACCSFLLACGNDAEREGETAATFEEPAAAATTTATPGTISLADVAGRWNVRVVTENGDSAPGFVLNATADRSGWTITHPNRQSMPVRVVEVSGDSIVTEAGPYPSVLRQGVNARLHTVSRLEGERLVGSTVARYETTGPDSVVRLRMEGTRAP
jgi:hypothetical protein